MVHPDTKRKLHQWQNTEWPKHIFGTLEWNHDKKTFTLTKMGKILKLDSMTEMVGLAFQPSILMKEIKYDKKSNSVEIPSLISDCTSIIIDMTDAKSNITIKIHNNVVKVIGVPTKIADCIDINDVCVKLILMDHVYPILQLYNHISIQNNLSNLTKNNNIHSISRAPGSGYIHKLVRCGTFYDCDLESAIGSMHHISNIYEFFSEEWDLYSWIHYPSGDHFIPFENNDTYDIKPPVLIMSSRMNYDSENLVIGLVPRNKFICQCYEIDVVSKFRKNVLMIPIKSDYGNDISLIRSSWHKTRLQYQIFGV